MTDNPYAAPQTDEPNSPIMPAEVLEGEPDYASRGIRFLGNLIDVIVIYVMAYLFGMFLAYSGLYTTETQRTWDLIFEILGIPLMIIVNSYFMFARAQTIGKWICQTVVVDKDTLQPISGIRYIAIRFIPLGLVSLIPGVGPVVAIIGALLIFRQEHNCLHDDIARTRVIKRKSLMQVEEDPDDD